MQYYHLKTLGSGKELQISCKHAFMRGKKCAETLIWKVHRNGALHVLCLLRLECPDAIPLLVVKHLHGTTDKERERRE